MQDVISSCGLAYGMNYLYLCGKNYKIMSHLRLDDGKMYDLKRFRMKIGLKQSEVAQLLGISTRHYQNIERRGGVGLVTLVEVILAMGGEFVFPVHPFDMFEVGGNLYRLSRYKSG